ncbi:glycosyltransferase family 39 protein [Candidatus Daviesbacteria bacterium]|nr:glycosyltransferase family 39 protein [Candidatus Daviesbacteria bacterium]
MLKLLNFHLIFILIFLLALVLRVYRIDVLTTFGRDQGIDFLVVLDIIENHNLTLIGIKTSIGEFFQGPNYIYMLVPAFFIFGLHPIAGAYTAVFVSLLSLILLIFFCLNFIGKRAAIFSGLIFALSPELVVFGNTPLYQNFLPLPLLLSLIFLFKSLNSNRLIHFFALGFMIGFAIEIHFLAITYALSLFIFLIFKIKNYFKIGIFILGCFFGFLPTITFELRNQFFNTNAYFSYIKQSGTKQFNLDNLDAWIKGASDFLAGNNEVIGILLLLSMIFILTVNKFKDTNLLNLRSFTFIYLFISIVASLKLNSFQDHYLLPLWIILIILIPTLLFINFKRLGYFLISTLIAINLVSTLSNLNNNHGYDMPKGWSLQKIQSTAKLIQSDLF